MVHQEGHLFGIVAAADAVHIPEVGLVHADQEIVWLSKRERALLITLPDGTQDNAHLYGFILIMRRLLRPEEFSSMKAEIAALSEKYSFVNLRHYGFREDWTTVL